MQSKITFNYLRRVIKSATLAVLFLSLFTGLATAQTYVNGPLSTGATSSDGSAAPAGYTWSEVQNPNTSAGYGASIDGGFTIIDNFTVIGAWNLTQASFFAYSTGYAGVTSPFNRVFLRIFNSDPSVGNPTPIFGDLTTNRFASSTDALMYRMFNGTAGTTRKIWRVNATAAISLPAGQYWIEWQIGTTTPGASNFSPAVTIPGIATQAGWDAKQRTISTNAIDAVVDGGGPQDFPFILSYTTGACSGTPTPGATLSTATSVCPNIPFTLSTQNPTAGSGVTYQWQSSSSATGPWTDIAGATFSTYSVANLTTPTYYQVIVTCSGNSGTSTPVMVGTTPSSNCYCTPGASDCSDEDVIYNVKIGGLDNTTDCSPGGYGSYLTADTAQLIIGGGNPIAVTTGTSWTEQVAVWIDYDRSGSFEANEFTDLGTIATAGVHNGNIIVPAGTTAGYTRMRVRVRFLSGLTSTTPCAGYSFGETEDYTVNLIPCVPIQITGAPASTSVTCGGAATFTATATGSIPVYQWQYRVNASSVWLPISNGGIYTGATTNVLHLTNVLDSYNGYQYRALISGACAGVDFTTPPATLTVNKLTPVISPASATICNGSIQQLSLTNTLGNADLIHEGFDVAVPLPAGWSEKNNSSPLGAAVFFQGNDGVFAAHSGAPTSYIGINYQSTTGAGTISNWLLSPTINIKNGDVFSFWTRTTDGATYADRLEVRLSTSGASVNVGATATSVGDFTTVLLTVNPTLISGPSGYPDTWTQYTATISGLPAPTTGKIGFRYYVTNGGPSGSNSDYIGIDDVVYTTTGGPAAGVWTSTATGTMFTDAGATTAYTGTPVNTIYVKPTTTSTYNVVYSTLSPCTSSQGSVTVTVNQPITGTSTVSSVSTCADGAVTFTASLPSGGSPLRHQWQVSTNGGATYTNVSNGATYSGATTATLNIASANAGMAGYMYRDSISVPVCGSFIYSSTGTLTVNLPPAVNLTAAPYTSLFPGLTTTLTVAVNPAPTSGTTYTWYKNGEEITSATTNTIPGLGVDDYGTYSVLVTSEQGCSTMSSDVKIKNDSVTTILFIYPSPTSGQFQVRYYSKTNLVRGLTIFDSKGSRIYYKRFPVGIGYSSMNVDLSNQPKGIYTVELHDGLGVRIQTGRVLVK